MKCPKCGSTDNHTDRSIPGLEFTICRNCKAVLDQKIQRPNT